jgi:hypothetical protein
MTDQKDTRRSNVEGIFNRANFISHLGLKLIDVG